MSKISDFLDMTAETDLQNLDKEISLRKELCSLSMKSNFLNKDCNC